MAQCKRCLLSEIDKDLYFKNVFEYIAQLDDELKADPKIYADRLATCKQCDQLINGMCRKCGCFVEVRAIKKAQYCPSERKLW